MNSLWERLRENQRNFEQKRRSQGGGGSNTPPEFDEILRKIKKLSIRSIIIILVIIVAIIFASSTIYQVELDEVGVVKRFGKYNRTSQPGLHFKLPMGIETVQTVMTKRIRKEEFGFKTIRSSTSTRFTDDQSKRNQSLMLTGDLNVAVVPWIVQYRIKDPYNYLFKVKDVDALVRDMSEATMRTVVGDRSINEVIRKRNEIATAAQERLQTELNQSQAGVNVVTVEMKKTNVPEPVRPSFNKVNESIQEKEQIIYQAREDYNDEVPAARGEAKRVIKDAEGYATKRVNRAKGNIAKFKSIYKEYKKAKKVTEKRMYLEAMNEIIPDLDHVYIIDSSQENLLPFLPLGAKGKSLKNIKSNKK